MDPAWCEKDMSKLLQYMITCQYKYLTDIYTIEITRGMWSIHLIQIKCFANDYQFHCWSIRCFLGVPMSQQSLFQDSKVVENLLSLLFFYLYFVVFWAATNSTFEIGDQTTSSRTGCKGFPSRLKGEWSLLLVGSELGVGSQADCWCLNLGYWGVQALRGGSYFEGNPSWCLIACQCGLT